MNTTISKQAFTELVRGFRFNELFNQMGWDNASGTMNLPVEDIVYRIETISEKKGFKVLQCKSPLGYPIPDANLRVKINAQLKKLHYEHLLIFTDETKKKQIWLYSYKPVGKSAKPITTEYDITQDPQLLYQRTGNLVFELEDEDNVTLVDVTSKITANIDQNAEKVTKKFYTDFKEQHNNFLKHLPSIMEELDRKWYASVMLNRLMFCYFIQKQGFLDGNVHYLSEKLQTCQLEHGRDKFYSFYRTFLLKLFHQGLGAPHGDELKVEFGKIPYLNGGIFSEHELEAKYGKDIAIDDTAFESLFQLFDKYNWHLDTRVTATGKDINPDVIGYIFEKYINDRAEMGAYYTKEDITDYIGKNTILPWLFDETQRKHKEPFMPDGVIWLKLKDSGDQYIYPAIKHGVNHADIWHDLPVDVRAGLNPEQPDLVEKRRCWNRLAPEGIALPTEIWRELIARRQRYLELRDIIQSGQICQINDLITYNLNIRQFTYDLLEETDDIQLIYQFYNALKKVTILDPTCGSGAFLFAAMNILEELYEVCLDKMDAYVLANPHRNNAHLNAELAPLKSDAHPNRQYFIYKSIILNNLYGVDIMNEAVEIAKLRLFLKLVACVEPNSDDNNYGLEPLPDVDFNIRCGNTLVGLANKKELDECYSYDLEVRIRLKDIEEKCNKVSKEFESFKFVQLSYQGDPVDFFEAKKKLGSELSELNQELNMTLHRFSSTQVYSKWLSDHKPFNWYAEYHSIMSTGGFNVIIGNPPYIEYPNKSITYSLEYYETITCGNLYAYCIERCQRLLSSKGSFSMIVPMSSISTERAKPVQKILSKGVVYISNFSGDRHPSELFDGVNMRLSILIQLNQTSVSNVHTTKYNKWYSAARPYLMNNLIYFDIEVDNDKSYINKYGSRFEKSIFDKIHLLKSVTIQFNKKESQFVYHNCPIHWVRAFDFYPYFRNDRDGEKLSSQFKNIYLGTDDLTLSFVGTLNSSLFYYWFVVRSDCWHLINREITEFGFDSDAKYVEQLKPVANQLMAFYRSISKRIKVTYKKTGAVEYDQIDTKQGKHLADKVDAILGNMYGFTQEELDHIVNYDIKFRMGGSAEGDE